MEMVNERRTCMQCGSAEGHGVVCYPVWAWDGKFMGRWCDWCRELKCWDCGEDRTDCTGDCSTLVKAAFA